VSTRGRAEDFSTILYLVPFIASGVYGLVLWVQNGISLTLPTSVYLTVTRDPYLFMLGSLSIMLGIIIEVNGTDSGTRPAKLVSLGNTLQSIAAASLILVLLSAWYANGFTDLTGMATDFIVGRYGLVFPAVLVLLSYLISAQFNLVSLANRKVLAIVAMLLVPVSLYEIGKRDVFAGLLVSLLLLLFGLGAYLVPEKKAPAPKVE
jgi:hypothetical protein